MPTGTLTRETEMTSAADRVREQLIHDLEELYEKRSQMEDFRPPVWQSLRFMGLVLVFIAALAWYTQTDWGLRCSRAIIYPLEDFRGMERLLPQP